MCGAAEIIFMSIRKEKIMKNNFNKKIAKVLITALCPLLLMSACQSSNPRSSARIGEAAYHGISVGIQAAVNQINK